MVIMPRRERNAAMVVGSGYTSGDSAKDRIAQIAGVSGMKNAGNHFSLNMCTVRKPRGTLFHSRNKVSQQAQANSGSLHSPRKWGLAIVSIIFVPQ